MFRLNMTKQVTDLICHGKRIISDLLWLVERMCGAMDDLPLPDGYG